MPGPSVTVERQPEVNPTHTYAAAGTYTVSLTVTDNDGASTTATTTAAISEAGGITSRGDTYATPVGTTLNVTASRISGVLYNDFGGSGPLTAQLVSGPANGSLNLSSDGSFTYTPNASLSDNDNDSFTYQASDGTNLSAVTTVNINILSKQTDFKIMMNYELGMHCTGFEFAYCCVLPPYNSILAQVVKPESGSGNSRSFPRLLEGDPNNTDGLGRPTVVRDYERNGTIKKYFLEYYHDAQPRHEGQGKPQTSTLISDVEGNSMFYTSTIYDSACRNLIDTNADGACPNYDSNLPEGGLVTGAYEGAYGVVKGSGTIGDVATDNYANGWLNHFYIYVDPATGGPNLEGHGATGLEADKIRLGVAGQVAYPANVGAALQPMGPESSTPVPFDNVLTFSGDTGTVVYTQMKVLEDLPIMLTSPKIWEALGLPLTPFEDSIDFFTSTGPGSLDEDSIRPYVAMKAALHVANCDADGLNCTEGAAVIGSNGKPVIGHGTAPIDIPNCERCHSVPAMTDGVANVNSPSWIRGPIAVNPDSTDPFAFPHAGANFGASLQAVTDAEKSFWDAYYGIVVGVDSDWYSRLKGAAVNMLALHDFDNGTSFTSKWPYTECVTSSCVGGPLTNEDDVPQNTRLGKESVICQKCHADNVIAVVKSATCAADNPKCSSGTLIKPITEAIHHRHREVSEGGSIDFADAAGRSGGCQGCHPAHRSDGVMDGYPITYGGDNAQAMSDNRLASGGCFVGRDVHSNPMKDVDGAETPAHLNAVGSWLASNVFYNQDGVAGVSGSPTRGLWCTNCHSQLGQEIWKAEDCSDLINGNCITNVRGGETTSTNLSPVVSAINSVLGTSYDVNQAIAWLDPTKDNPLGDFTHAIWDPAIPDADLAIIEVNAGGNCNVSPWTTSSGGICVKIDTDGDPSVRILDFCTTPDCVATAQAALDGEGNGSDATPVPFSAATDARDHWLAPGEPHCADCHAAPYVEPSGGNAGEKNFKPPFNYPRKASLMRYSTGHQGVSCQGCHESIHGLYPVTPAIDTTSYAQAAALNGDGSHGPLKCGTCHTVDSSGRPSWIQSSSHFGGSSFDGAVGWAHTFTEEASVLDSVCLNCHGVQGSNWADIASSDPEGTWLRHAMDGRTSREMMDKAQIEKLGHVYGDPAYQNTRTTVCEGCHGDEWSSVSCSGENATEWRQHLTQGRVSQSIWEYVTKQRTGGTCGW